MGINIHLFSQKKNTTDQVAKKGGKKFDSPTPGGTPGRGGSVRTLLKSLLNGKSRYLKITADQRRGEREVHSKDDSWQSYF